MEGRGDWWLDGHLGDLFTHRVYVLTVNYWILTGSSMDQSAQSTPLPADISESVAASRRSSATMAGNFGLQTS